MLRSRNINAFILVSLLATAMLGFSGCFGGMNTMGLHLFSMKIEVRGPNNAPLIGAIVSAATARPSLSTRPPSLPCISPTSVRIISLYDIKTRPFLRTTSPCPRTAGKL